MQWIRHKQFTHLYYDHAQQQYRLFNGDVNELQYNHLFNDWELIKEF